MEATYLITNCVNSEVKFHKHALEIASFLSHKSSTGYVFTELYRNRKEFSGGVVVEFCLFMLLGIKVRFLKPYESQIECIKESKEFTSGGNLNSNLIEI